MYISFLLGCSKCLKSFPRDERNRPDYSGYTCDQWILRKGSTHKELALDWLHSVNKKERHEIEFNHGVKFSELFRLPYFDPIRMHVVDPMYNLMLGKITVLLQKYWFNCVIYLN